MRYCLLLLVLFVFAGCTQGIFRTSSLNPQTDISGVQSHSSYEMYSWYNGQDWAFALFENGTKITSSFADITDSNDIVVGVEPAAEKIFSLPRGSRVYWNLKRIKGFSLPDENAISKIVTGAKKNGVFVEVIAWPS